MNEAARVPEWEETKESLRVRIPDPFYTMFIAPIHAVEDAHTGLVLHVPDHRLIPHIQSRYFPLILDGLKATSFHERVRISSAEADRNARALRELAGAGGHRVTDDETASDHGNSSNLSAGGAGSKPQTRRFCASRSNAADVERLRTGPGLPVTYVYGPPGSGKTTLALELVASVQAQGRRAAYLTLEDFLHAFARACRDASTIAWKEELRGNDLLCIDDIQFLKRSAHRTQEELRHLIDIFERDGRSLILLADAPAKSLPFPADLSSRLLTSKPVALELPDSDARTAILEQECRQLDMVVEKTVLSQVADMIRGDGRRLHSAALRMFHSARDRLFLSGSDLAAEFQDLIDTTNTAGPELVLSLVADFYKVHPDAIKGPARDRRFTEARHLSAYLLTELLPLRFLDAAKILGRKHHTQIIYARRKIEEKMEKDLFFEREVRSLRRRILDQSRLGP